ncbi:uncharacterized protein LOC121626663 [Chelmon rostratus]|uniref:uncharacterized protein LOC121626663 n=1 Tax=Chelmon rostratus TaxID=109905 RepID=UPI001BEB3A05|nr:uncharacterized protein LOC121626663 [Chelmon rostratus]
MMKSWRHLCFLVLAMSSVSRGQNETAAVSHDEDHTEKTVPTPGPLTPNESKDEAVRPTSPSPSPQSQTPTNADLLTSAFRATPAAELSQHTKVTPITDAFSKAKEDDGGTAAQPTTVVGVPGSGKEGGDVSVVTEVSTATESTPTKPAKSEEPAPSSWGYVILVLIVLVIIVLCAILYLLRRVSRTYSFDLHRPVPGNNLNEPIGTFEQVYLDDLDQPAPKDQLTTDDLSSPSAANGTTLQSEEKGSSGENAPHEPPAANGTGASLTSNTSPSLGDDPVDKTPGSLNSNNLLLDAVGEDQPNENNNNPLVCSSDPFVEINLDDPAWCDQLLTSPEAPSSVLPFSPFSFSSSSSSSSSS